MRAVIQRVASSSVEVGGRVVSSVESGLLVYLGVTREDVEADADYLAEKVRHLRIFEDEAGRMNRDVVEAGGGVLAVSAFTVCAAARQGRRPAFTAAAPAEAARPLYEHFCEALNHLGVSVHRGAFGEHMRVYSINDGPVVILLDSRKLF